jgi:hypothetical protein
VPGQDYPAADLQAEARPAGRSAWRARLRPWADELPPPEPPKVLISLPLEGSPSLWLAGCGPGDHDRLLAWLERNPRLLALVGDALELEKGEAED